MYRVNDLWGQLVCLCKNIFDIMFYIFFLLYDLWGQLPCQCKIEALALGVWRPSFR
jgi:hypothetical protein